MTRTILHTIALTGLLLTVSVAWAGKGKKSSTEATDHAAQAARIAARTPMGTVFLIAIIDAGGEPRSRTLLRIKSLHDAIGGLPRRGERRR